ncbi:hypothetical protein GUITHDRAFT_132225 [Guillardia theta CCMP2712]|uniref:Alpha-(1,6)-fucosyltransferase N- and catalytic domain-containing protein n=2 Tax=Guillardia theta TaxID=55529 RepID=L1K2B0_GUITC|nr:hypothetical protein GUITHDRAFT_132225 [Guillardia theta CCMP2712]EKX54513.1 hypothetical protein GUITHDRAFT_132225 [Guillardia theta CCMP2712]|eukprot:XP_005841493.1 hypothetical protein GUITHDRAFT_132225 [Guillardia theta CCMP2712]
MWSMHVLMAYRDHWSGEAEETRRTRSPSVITCILILNMLAQAGTADSSDGLCSFEQRIDGMHCDGLKIDGSILTSRACTESCCMDKDCQIWQYHSEKGCWKGSQAAPACTASDERWLGEKVRNRVPPQRPSGESSRILQWRRRKGIVKNCCPGRWCCPGGSGCCPPRMLAIANSEQFAAMDLTARSKPFQESITLLAEEVQEGLIRFCIAFDVFIKPLHTTIRVDKQSKIMALVKSSCRELDRIRGQENNSNCFQEIVYDIVQSGVDYFLNASYPGILFAHGLESDAAVDRCSATRLTVSSWNQVNSFNVSRCRPSHHNAFRWLTTRGYDIITMASRHSRGQARESLTIPQTEDLMQVVVSDQYRFIFIQVPKAASTTVRVLLWNYGGKDAETYDKLPLHKKLTYFTFAFVRDPVSRFISAYDEICLKLHDSCSFYDRISSKGLKAFLNYTIQNPCWDEHVCEQMSFLQGFLRIDMIADISNLSTALTYISSRLGFEPPVSPDMIEKKNEGFSFAHQSPDEKTARKIRSLFSSDYECLNFSTGVSEVQNSDGSCDEDADYNEHLVPYAHFWNEGEYYFHSATEDNSEFIKSLTESLESVISSQSFSANDSRVATLPTLESRIPDVGQDPCISESRGSLAASVELARERIVDEVSSSSLWLHDWSVRAILLSKLWSPEVSLEKNVKRRSSHLPPGFVLLVIPRCHGNLTEDTKRQPLFVVTKEQRIEERLPPALPAACYTSVEHAKRDLLRERIECSLCLSVAHVRLLRFMLIAQQARENSAEGGRLDTAIVVSEDTEILRIYFIKIDTEEMSSMFPTWHLRRYRTYDEETEEEQVGSLSSHFFNILCDFFIGNHFERFLKNGNTNISMPYFALSKLWSADVQLGSGPAGFLGANIPLSSSSTKSSTTQTETWEGTARGEEGNLRQHKKGKSPCPGNRFSVDEWGDCKADITSTSSYLPSPQVLQYAKAEASAGDELAAHLQHSLHSLQFSRQNCDRARPARYPNHGAAATFNYLVIQLIRGLQEQRPVVLQGKWIYGGCAEGDLSCVLDPFTVCETGASAVGGYSMGPDMSGKYGGAYPQRLEEADPNYVPPIYAREGKGNFWFVSILTGFVLNVRPRVSQRVEEELQRLGLSSSFVGVQIRRGDACGQTRPCLELSIYVEAIQELAGRYDLKSVYLATDDPNAVVEVTDMIGGTRLMNLQLEGAVAPLGLHVVSQMMDRSFTSSNTVACAHLANEGVRTLSMQAELGCEWIEDKLLRADPDRKDDHAMAVMVDVEILARSSAFVGTFTSALSRVALQLSFARTQQLKPFISLDIPWCWAGFHLIPVPWGTYGC